VFMTGTAAEVTPVRELDGVTYATGRSTLAALLQRAYLQAVTGQSSEYAHWLTTV
jgi:branched-chain amino acid aminotransferase